jgi:hypothetical protein
MEVKEGRGAMSPPPASGGHKKRPTMASIEMRPCLTSTYLEAERPHRHRRVRQEDPRNQGASGHIRLEGHLQGGAAGPATRGGREVAALTMEARMRTARNIFMWQSIKLWEKQPKKNLYANVLTILVMY